MLWLSEAGLSGRRIAATQGVSRNSVSEVLAAAREAGIDWRKAEAMTDAEVYERLFPGRVLPEPVYPDPDWERVHRELARVGVTLKRLHEEHRDEARAKGEPSMSYDRFRKRHRELAVGRQVVSRVGHKAGRIVEVDWAGPTMQPVDPATGEVELNEAYREMAAHYGSAVMPARIATPRDKPSVENEVRQAAAEIVAALV